MAKKQRRVVPLEELVPRALIESMRDGTDLACALIGGAYIENAAGSLLEKIMVDAPEANGPNGILNDHKGILGTASARIEMCFCLGLIDRATRKNAKTIAQIRNMFAHSHVPVGFSNAPVRRECENLQAQLSDPEDAKVFAGMVGGLSIPVRPIKPLDPATARQILSNPRRRFVFAACWTFLVLHQAWCWAKGHEQIHRERMTGKKGPAPLPSENTFLHLRQERNALAFDTVVLLDV